MAAGGDADHLSLVFHRVSHLLQQQVPDVVEYPRLAIEAQADLGERIEALEFGHGQRTQQHGINEAEGRGAGPKSQSEREHGDGRAQLSLDELPPAEYGVGAQRIQPGDQPQIAAFVAAQERGAEGAARLVRIASILDRIREVRLDFFVDLAAQAVGVKNIRKA